MTDQIYRITVRDATLSGPVAGKMTIIGYIVECEPETPIKPDFVSRNRKVDRLFRYVNNLYQTEGKTAFDFAELSEAITGNDCKMSKNALAKLIRRISMSLAVAGSPLSLTYNREILYVKPKLGFK